MIPIVYVAGPYRASTAWGVDLNIQSARRAGAKVALFGAMPLVPHANTAHYDGLQNDQFWLDGTMELLRRSDAVLMIEGWSNSSGARAEMDEAIALEKPVFFTLESLKKWLKKQPKP